jgi:hypothetical protein
MPSERVRSLTTPVLDAQLRQLEREVEELWHDGLARRDDEQVERSAEAGRALRAVVRLLTGDVAVSER